MKKKFGNAAKKKIRSEINGKENFFFHTKFVNGVLGVLPKNQENVFFLIFFYPLSGKLRFTAERAYSC